MLEQLRNCIPVPGVLFQANQDEIFGLVADRRRFRKPYLIFHNLDKIPLRIYIKRHPSEQQLIREYAHAPHVNLVIVVFPF